VRINDQAFANKESLHKAFSRTGGLFINH